MKWARRPKFAAWVLSLIPLRGRRLFENLNCADNPSTSDRLRLQVFDIVDRDRQLALAENRDAPLHVDGRQADIGPHHGSQLFASHLYFAPEGLRIHTRIPMARLLTELILAAGASARRP
jgi:hypothetical protein